MTSDRRKRSIAAIAALSCSVLIGIVGCGDNSAGGSIEIVCGDGVSDGLSMDAPVLVSSGAAADLAGASVAVDNPAVALPQAVSIECAADIAPPGFVALGPAVSFGPTGHASDRPFSLTVPYKAARLPEGAGRRHVRIVARRHLGDTEPFFPPISNRALEDDDPFRSRVSFRAPELVTYQAVAAADAGQTETRRFTYRAISGISMGGNASMSIGLRHHDKFDFILDLGGEPGPSMKYTLTMIRDYLFGGFCSAADEASGQGVVGQMCPGSQRAVHADQFERKSNFEAMLFEEGSGVGLTLKRKLYIKASRDLSRAMGNPAHYNPDHPYLPPGVPELYLETPVAERCETPVVLEDFFDQEFNPDGSNPVITFCDGGDSEALGFGIFDPSVDQTEPAEVLLAVDLNDNGVRDAGEPVVTNAFEPFADVGTDGVADADEVGPLGAFDAATNPDPAGDNYHAVRNPNGTERNDDREDGEPFDDIGIDGVGGTCQAGQDPGDFGVAGCYDTGEGDGVWTISPNLARWYQSDMGVLLASMSAAERSRINVWLDAGIRDFLNGAVSANAGFANLMATHGLEGQISDNFAPLSGASNDATFDFFKIRFEDLPRNVYVRYGDPDANQAKIELGDGRHVGTALQLVNRVTTSFTWLEHQWPNGDREDETGAGSIDQDLVFTTSGGRDSPYAIFLPPGYMKPENAARTYPVVYFLHGYGQEPRDLVILSGIFENYMTNPSVAPEERFQKFMMVYVDGRCRPNMDGVPVPPDGDLCENGTFYLDSPITGHAQMETNMLELMDFIDANFRTKPEELVEVIK